MLIVDDDPAIREVIRFALRRDGIETIEAGDGVAALREFDTSHPDLVVLDVMMPEMDGTDVCRKIRERSATVPVLFLSSRTDEVDRIVGLEVGGDDYILTPFSPRELVARVRAALRRTRAALQENPEPSARTLVRGKLALDPDRFLATWSDREVTLTPVEFGLLRSLLERPGAVLSRESLMESGYSDPTIVSGRTIDSHIRRLRRKFAEAGGDPIETVHGVGYRVGRCD